VVSIAKVILILCYWEEVMHEISYPSVIVFLLVIVRS
jgi:hypothetical protein